MASRHREGYHSGYKADQSEADRLLKEAHREEWQSYFDALRAKRKEAETIIKQGQP